MKEKIKNLKNENVKKVEEVELQPSWSKLKSFHGKATIGTKENGDKYLKSFGFLICEIIKGEVKIHNEVEKWDSKSTIRHINNFLYENGFETGNTKELTELYITKIRRTGKIENKKETKPAEDKEPKNKKVEEPKTEKKAPVTETKVTIPKTVKNKKIENSKTEKVIEVVGA